MQKNDQQRAGLFKASNGKRHHALFREVVKMRLAVLIDFFSPVFLMLNFVKNISVVRGSLSP